MRKKQNRGTRARAGPLPKIYSGERKLRIIRYREVLVKSQSGGDHHDALGREISTCYASWRNKGGRGESSMTCLTDRAIVRLPCPVARCLNASLSDIAAQFSSAHQLS